MFRPILLALLPTLILSAAVGSARRLNPRLLPCQLSCSTTMTFLTVTSVSVVSAEKTYGVMKLNRAMSGARSSRVMRVSNA